VAAAAIGALGSRAVANLGDQIGHGNDRADRADGVELTAKQIGRHRRHDAIAGAKLGTDPMVEQHQGAPTCRCRTQDARAHRRRAQRPLSECIG